MKKKLRQAKAFWKWLPGDSKGAAVLFPTVLITTLVIRYALNPFSHRLAKGFFWSFYNSESSTSWWLGQFNLSVMTVIFVTSLFSLASSACWIPTFYGSYSALMKTFNLNGNGEEAGSWYHKLARKLPSAAVSLSSLGPDGGIITSAYLGRVSKLNVYQTIALSMVGSVIKNVVFCLGFSSPHKILGYITWAFFFFVLGHVVYKILKGVLRQGPHRNINPELLQVLAKAGAEA